MDAVEQSLVRLRMKLVAQKPDHPAAKPHPVGQHGLGQELADFVNAGVLHAGAEDYSENRNRKYSTVRNFVPRFLILIGAAHRHTVADVG